MFRRTARPTYANKRYKRVFTKKNISKYKKANKQYKRAATYKRNITAKETAMIQIPMFNTPSKLIKNQMYNESGIILSGAIGAIPYRFYRANDLYDPRDGAGGDQPIAFDQLMLLFEHFAVIRSKITVSFCNAASTAVTVGIALFPDNNPSTDYNNLIENGYIKTVNIPGFVGDNIRTISLDCDVKNYFGKKYYKDIMDDEKLTGDVANAPLEKVYYYIFAHDSFGLASDISVGFNATISYDSIYFEPRKLVPS